MKKTARINKNKKPLPPLFDSADDWHNNACIPTFTSDKQIPYIEGYKLAADILVNKVNETGRSQDFLVYPIAFLYRHHLELLLKQIIADGRDLLKNEAGYPQHHKIDALWEEVKSLIRKTWKTADPPEMRKTDHVISEFMKLDPTGEGFRYGHKKDGQDSLTDIKYINLRHLAECIGEVAEFLDGVSTGISVYRDERNEMASYYRNQ
ncbi:MAG: hypothetical protein PHI84_01585 [Kiritimatiellae bacterium]|nr:hypothetical protein [Kiritimatiellia bacterium]